MKDRILEVAMCIESFIILVLFTIVLYFIIEYNVPPKKYDLNHDDQVDIQDLMISIDKSLEIRDYILDNES